LLLLESSCFLWCSKYSFTISSVIFPVLQHPKPIAQKWRPQYLFFNSGNSICIFLDVRHFINLTKVLISCDGRYSICIWSFETTPFKIWTPSTSHICIKILQHLTFISPCKTAYRYFVAQTIWSISLNCMTFCSLNFHKNKSSTFLEAKAKCTKVHSFNYRLWPINPFLNFTNLIIRNEIINTKINAVFTTKIFIARHFDAAQEEQAAAERMSKEKKNADNNWLLVIQQTITDYQTQLKETEKKLNDASGFKLLRTASEKKEQMNLLQKNIDSFKIEMVKLKNESDQLRLELEKIQ